MRSGRPSGAYGALRYGLSGCSSAPHAVREALRLQTHRARSPSPRIVDQLHAKANAPDDRRPVLRDHLHHLDRLANTLAR